MKSNEVLQKDVQEALKWEPMLNAAEIGVIAKNGVITLTGTVDSYTKKLEAEHAAKNVSGVKAVIEKIEIQFGSTWQKKGEEIASEVLGALKANWEIPFEKIKVKVEDGWVTLDGELSWNYQKIAATDAIKNLIGVKGVTNSIVIRPDSNDAIEAKEIENALTRSWSVNQQKINISVLRDKVTITGCVESFYQKNEAERIAWNAKGVCSVDNQLVIDYAHTLAN